MLAYLFPVQTGPVTAITLAVLATPISPSGALSLRAARDLLACSPACAVGTKGHIFRIGIKVPVSWGI